MTDDYFDEAFRRVLGGRPVPAEAAFLVAFAHGCTRWRPTPLDPAPSSRSCSPPVSTPDGTPPARRLFTVPTSLSRLGHGARGALCSAVWPAASASCSSARPGPEPPECFRTRSRTRCPASSRP
jgi:hypothetical protein